MKDIACVIDNWVVIIGFVFPILNSRKKCNEDETLHTWIKFVYSKYICWRMWICDQYEWKLGLWPRGFSGGGAVGEARVSSDVDYWTSLLPTFFFTSSLSYLKLTPHSFFFFNLKAEKSFLLFFFKESQSFIFNSKSSMKKKYCTTVCAKN